MKASPIFLDLIDNRPISSELTIRYFEEDDDHEDMPPLSYYWHPSKNNILTIEMWGDRVIYAGILGGVDCWGECTPGDLIPSVIVDWIAAQDEI